MDDAESGSSSAAQGAQDQIRKRRAGLFRRLLAAFKPANGMAPEAGETVMRANGAVGAAPALELLNLHRLRVEDVAIPKADIVSVAEDATKDELFRKFRDSGLTRLPVYEETLDKPIGMVHLKDFALQHGFNGSEGRFYLRKLLRPLLFVPRSMPIGVLMQKMQSQRMHLALVIDEYGGVDGLVSIENLIEQVIGEIEDEHDVEEGQHWIAERPGCYLARAKAPLEDFEKEIGLKLAEGEDGEEVDTLGGLVFMLSGRVPARGEVIRHPSGTEFEIVDADLRRIKRLRVRIAAQPDG